MRELDMTMIEKRYPGLLETPTPLSSSGPSERVEGYLKRLAQIFRPRHDSGILSERLRRDAGINEIDFEVAKAARAPLIR
jgi:hypothetical protein